MLDFVEFLSSSDEDESHGYNDKNVNLDETCCVNTAFDQKKTHHSLATKQNNQQKKRETIATINQLKTQ